MARVKKYFKTSPHTGGTSLRQCSRVNFCSAESSRVRQALATIIVNSSLACVAALFWGRVSVLLILEGLERNAKKKTRKNDLLKLIRHSPSPKIAPLRRLIRHWGQQG